MEAKPAPALIPKGKQIHNNPSPNSVQTGSTPDHVSCEASFPLREAQTNPSQAVAEFEVTKSHIQMCAAQTPSTAPLVYLK